MTRLFWRNSITAGELGSLKELDPADSSGDGSNDPLVSSQDVCIVAGDTYLLFYALMESAGAVDDGFNVIVPAYTPGNLWWKLCGYTASEFDADAGEVFNIDLNSDYIPDNFTYLGDVPFTDYVIRKMFDVNSAIESQPDTCGFACGIYGIWLYSMLNDGTNSLKCNIITNEVEAINPDGESWVWSQCCGWAEDYPRFIIDIDVWGNVKGFAVLRVFDMHTEKFGYLYPDNMADVVTRHPGTTGPNAMGLGTKIYIVGCTTGTTNKLTAYQVDSAQFEYLADLPAAVGAISLAIDPINNSLYVFDTLSTGNAYKYDVANNSWSSIAACPVTGETGCYGGIKGGKIYFVDTDKIHFYDISGNSWESIDYAFGGNPKYRAIFSEIFGLIIPGGGNNCHDIFQIPPTQPKQLQRD